VDDARATSGHALPGATLTQWIKWPSAERSHLQARIPVQAARRYNPPRSADGVCRSSPVRCLLHACAAALHQGSQPSVSRLGGLHARSSTAQDSNDNKPLMPVALAFHVSLHEGCEDPSPCGCACALATRRIKSHPAARMHQ
jgi:hypothetical protein